MMVRRAPFVAAAAALLSASATASADDTSDIESILSEHVITTASTTAQKASAAPALSTTITADDLRTFGIQSLAEAINFLSLGVTTTESLRTPDIGSRGVLFGNDDGKHFLLLIDGHAINDPLYGAARFDQGAGVPIEAIDHIEVIAGPGSVLYGSNAMMGVVNVITKSAVEAGGVHALADYEIGRSVLGSASTGASFDVLGAPIEVTAAAEYYQRFGPNLDFGSEQFPTEPGNFKPPKYNAGSPATNLWGGTLTQGNFAQAPSALLRIRSGDFEANVSASTYKRSIPYATEALAAVFDDPNNYELDRSVRGDLRHQTTISRLVQLSSRVYADAKDYQRRVDVPGAYCLREIDACEYYDAGLVRWIGLEERLSLNWLHDQSLVTLLGIDARDQWASAKEDIQNAETGRHLGATAGHIDVNAGLIAPYVQQTYSPTAWLDLNGGARLDADTRYAPVLSPRAAAAVRPWYKGTIKAVYSQAFRAPTWSETVLANYQTAPSDNVQPETVRAVEASVEQRFGTQRILFGVFRTWWSNLIESTTLSTQERIRDQTLGLIPPIVSNLVQYTNVASIDNYGWNGGWDGSVDQGRLRYGVNVTGAFTRLDVGTGPAPLALAPQVFGNAHVAYALGGYAPTTALAATLLGPRPADRVTPAGERLPDAPTTADLRLTLSGLVPFLSGLGYRASAEYITASNGPYTAGPTDTHAFLSKSLYPTPVFAPIDQFRVFVGLRYDFDVGASAWRGEVQ